MSSDVWKCMNIYTRTREDMNRLTEQVVLLMRQLKIDSHLEAYFYNRYSNKNSNFIKLGYVNSDDSVDTQVERFIIENNVAEKIEPYDCEMWEVNGKPIDRVKCISCELSEIVKDNFYERITIEQAFYLLHFMMNQLGFNYNEEVALYDALLRNIKRQLGTN